MIMKCTAQFSGSIHVHLRANVNENREMNKGGKSPETEVEEHFAEAV
jgi:hypothetical protein